MKKRVGLLVAVALIFVALFAYSREQKKNVAVQKVQATFFREEKKIYDNSQVKQYLKPISVHNIDMAIYSGQHSNEYYVYSKEAGIDTKHSPIDITEVNPLAGNRVYMPKYNLEKISYCPYYNYYKVDLKAGQVEQVDKYYLEHHKGHKLFSSNNYSVDKTIQKIKPLSSDDMKKDQKLLFAAVIYYGFQKVDIQRWKALSSTVSGWQVERTSTGRNLVWENKNIKDSEKKLAPNYFLKEGNSIIYRSFIVHSGGKEMQHVDQVSAILAYINKDYARLKKVYSMKNMIHVTTS